VCELSGGASSVCVLQHSKEEKEKETSHYSADGINHCVVHSHPIPKEIIQLLKKFSSLRHMKFQYLTKACKIICPRSTLILFSRLCYVSQVGFSVSFRFEMHLF
jgi:hypothetical protein